jgi:hypothetical protein
MSDRPSSPFARLDTSLLRSTKPAATPEPPAPAPEFQPRSTPPSSPSDTPSSAPAPASPRVRQRPLHRDTATPRSHETVTPRHRERQASRHHDTVVAAMMPQSASEASVGDHPLPEEAGADTLVAIIRRAVRGNGREGATLRLTQAEKQQLKDLVYTYSRRGKRTSETELIRIGLNAMLEDYRANGERSLVARVLIALDL